MREDAEAADLNAKLYTLVDTGQVGFGEDDQEGIVGDQIEITDQRSFEKCLLLLRQVFQRRDVKLVVLGCLFQYLLAGATDIR